MKREPKQSRGRPDGGPHSSKTPDIFFVDTNTFVNCEIDETLEIKEEIVLDPDTTGKKWDERYGSKVCTMDISDAAVLDKNKLWNKPEKKYKCNRCSRTYQQKRSLTSHQKFDCGVMPQFACKFCAKRFHRKSVMKLHMNTLHMHLEQSPTKTQFICDFCGYTVNGKCNLEEHITSCHSQPSTKRFRESKSIDESLEIKKEIMEDAETSGQERNEIYDSKVCAVDTTQFRCKLCDKWYTRKYNFIRHMNCVHKRLQLFSCERCEYRTNHEGDFSRHLATCHLQVSRKRYNCDKCSRSYNWLRDLTRHQRLKHAAVIPLFICDYCGFRTNLKSSLATHITKRHYKEFNDY
ncbi:zinc finger protein 761-like [Belonocnema kinseyi]|uniref:zinc finger protein 761-like n=1 Tax=Belonocnema kinseyi TaxID=2817044 RepID=UPI00143DF290|nr:zinc finger protein 761-like [Belonocnema kinseyi]